jgi:hypothetical protein
MACEDCNRNNVVCSYCYWSRRTEYYKDLTGQELTFSSFAVFAIELQLEWKIPYCSLMPRTELVLYWHCLEPFLVAALHRKLSEEQATISVYVTWDN